MTQNKILAFWIVVAIAAAVAAAMSFMLLIGFILGGVFIMGAGAVVTSYSLLVDVRDRDEIAAHHIAAIGVHEKLN
jgi:hypothetical protein